MGVTVWRYHNPEEGHWKRVSRAWFDRFWDGNERLEGAQEARFADVVVFLEDREPVPGRLNVTFSQLSAEF